MDMMPCCASHVTSQYDLSAHDVDFKDHLVEAIEDANSPVDVLQTDVDLPIVGAPEIMLSETKLTRCYPVCLRSVARRSGSRCGSGY